MSRPAVDPAAPAPVLVPDARLPDGRWVLLSEIVEGGRMTAPVSRPAARLGRFGRLWWLPAGGYGNGLDDQAWAPALQVSGQVVPQLLSALREAAVPAYAARRAGAA